MTRIRKIVASILELQPSTDSILVGGKSILLLSNMWSEKKGTELDEKKEVIHSGINFYYKSLYVVHK